MKRREFLLAAGASSALPALQATTSKAAVQERTAGDAPNRKDNAETAGRIANDYSLFLAGEEASLEKIPKIFTVARGSIEAEVNGKRQRVTAGKFFGGWQLLCTARMNGTVTAVLEKTVTHQGVIVYVTEAEGLILKVPKQIGFLSSIRPRKINPPEHARFTRRTPYVPGPDVLGNYILSLKEDPGYENVASLGKEYVGYSLVADEGAGPLRSLFIAADGSSRELADKPEARWAPDLVQSLFNPSSLFPGEAPGLYNFVEGYSKRTLLNGFLPVAHTGVWNPESKNGYEVMVVWPRGENAEPVGMVRASVPPWMAKSMAGSEDLRQNPDGTYFVERYWETSRERFWEAVAGVANYWQHFFHDQMRVEIPDRWLLDAARAGVVLSRCSYRGLAPTYQIGEGAYTKIPERSHALFPVAHYEFIWAQQLWNLTHESDAYFQFYLDHYILPDGNFLYNTQDQVEAPMNAGVVLWNSARAFDYTGDLNALKKRLPILRRMLEFVLKRYEYGKHAFPSGDRRHGLIWGSPEADLGSPANDFPNSHPLYFQNSVWIWRGVKEHSRCLRKAAGRITEKTEAAELTEEAEKLEQLATEMRGIFERSINATVGASSEAMKRAGITPFTPGDVDRDPKGLSSYENHRFMMDWFTADWGVPALDKGHLEHRRLAGYEVMGLHTDAAVSRTSNFMSHGTLAARIREDDYRPFLLTLYSLCCYAADSGNRYSPEDAYLPGGFPGEGNPYQWSAVVNSVLQPTMGLRWLLCYEESNAEVCHLQKAAPKHWFAQGQQISAAKCPTRFGSLTWRTKATSDRTWDISVETPDGFSGDLVVHIHAPGGDAIRTSSAGRVERGTIVLGREAFKVNGRIDLQASV